MASGGAPSSGMPTMYVDDLRPPPPAYGSATYASPEYGGGGGPSQERQRLLNRDGTANEYDPQASTIDTGLDETPKKARNFCGRTFFLVFLFMGLTAMVCILLLLKVSNGLYWAFGWSFGCAMIFSMLSNHLCSFLYRRAKSEVNWVHTLRSTVFWCALLTGLSVTIGGYFLRELNAATSGTSYNALSVKDPPKVDLGQALTFYGAARVYPEFGGRTVGFGVFPVCVAPILELATDKTVNYWAVSNGPCCAKNPMNCEGWTDGMSRGATVLPYREVYPNANAAAEQARDPPLNMIPNPNAVYVRYGDVDKIKANLKFYGILVLCLGLGLTSLLALYKTLAGPY